MAQPPDAATTLEPAKTSSTRQSVAELGLGCVTFGREIDRVAAFAMMDYRRLAAAHSNLVAVKCSTDDPAILADLLTVSPRLKFFFTEFGYTLARRQTSDIGLLISLATANYARAHEFVAGDDAGRNTAVDELRLMGASLREISAGRFHIDGAFDKMLYRLTDPTFPLRLLPPYATATEADFARFRASLPARWANP